MQTLVKTTITLPEDMLQTAKLTAVREKTNLSALIRLSLSDRLSGQIKQVNTKTNIANFFRSLPNRPYRASGNKSPLDQMFANKWQHQT